MKYLLSLTAITLMPLFSQSCKSTKKPAESQAETEKIETREASGKVQKLVFYSQGPCFGRCAVYNMTLQTDSTLRMEGRNFVDQIGYFYYKLSGLEYNDLLSKYKNINFVNLQDKYDSQISDISIHEFMFFDKDNVMIKKVWCRGNVPPELETLGVAFNSYINKKGWVLDKEATDSPDDEVIVQLAPGVDIKNLLPRYERWNAIIKDTLSATNNIYLIKFDKAKIEPERFMNMLRRDTEVKMVEKNKKVQSRQ